MKKPHHYTCNTSPWTLYFAHFFEWKINTIKTSANLACLSCSILLTFVFRFIHLYQFKKNKIKQLSYMFWIHCFCSSGMVRNLSISSLKLEHRIKVKHASMCFSGRKKKAQNTHRNTKLTKKEQTHNLFCYESLKGFD